MASAGSGSRDPAGFGCLLWRHVPGERQIDVDGAHADRRAGAGNLERLPPAEPARPGADRGRLELRIGRLELLLDRLAISDLASAPLLGPPLILVVVASRHLLIRIVSTAEDPAQ